MIKLFSILTQTIGYVAEGSIEAFAPAKDSYPLTGVQPFEGESFDAKGKHHR